MALNTNPVFSAAPLTPHVANLSAGNTAYDGTGTATLLFTAGADGAYVDRIILRPLGTNVASVARLFTVTGANNSVAANNALIDEVGLPATAATQIAALTPSCFISASGLYLVANEKLYVTLGTTVAAGYAVTAFIGNLAA